VNNITASIKNDLIKFFILISILISFIVS